MHESTMPKTFKHHIETVTRAHKRVPCHIPKIWLKWCWFATISGKNSNVENRDEKYKGEGTKKQKKEEENEDKKHFFR